MTSVPNPSAGASSPVTAARPSVRTVLLAVAAALLGGAIPVGFAAAGVPETPDVLSLAVMGAAVALSLVIVGVLVRGVRAILLPLVAAGLCVLFAGPYAAAALFALVVAVACLGFLSAADRVNPLWYLAVGAVSYGVALALTRDATLSVLSLLPYPAAAFLSHANADRAGRAETFARVSAGLCLSAVLVACIIALVRDGHIDTAAFLEQIDALRPAVKQSVLDAGSFLGTDVIDEKYATALTDSFFNALPAMVVMLFEVGGYLVQLLEAGLFRREAARTGKEIFSRAETDRFCPSAIGGAIYVFATVVTMFASLFGGTGMFLTVMDNFMLVLLLPMGLYGVQYLGAMYRNPAGRFRLFPIVFALLTVFLYGFVFAVPILFEAVAFLGGVSALLRPLAERIERMKKDGGQNGT